MALKNEARRPQWWWVFTQLYVRQIVCVRPPNADAREELIYKISSYSPDLLPESMEPMLKTMPSTFRFTLLSA